MKKCFYVTLAALLVLALSVNQSSTPRAETLKLSGSTIYLTIPEFSDTLTSIHSRMWDFESATGDTLTDVHTKLQTVDDNLDGLVSATPDTLTDIHTKLQVVDDNLDGLVSATADTLTDIHTKLQAADDIIDDLHDTDLPAVVDTLHVIHERIISDIEDTLTNIHTKLQVVDDNLDDLVSATLDTLTDIHTKLQAVDDNLDGLISATADTLTDVHTKLQTVDDNLDALISATADTLTDIHTKLQIVDDLIDAATDTLTNIHTKLQTVDDMVDGVEGATGVLYEQADVVVNTTAPNDANTDIFDLNTASTRYVIRGLILKCADPGANTVTVSLVMLINDVATVVDTFEITTVNFGDYFQLQDMFTTPQLAGDDIQIYVRASAGGPYAVTGQYSYAKTNN